MQRCPARLLAGRTVRFQGELRSQGVVRWAGLWLRADGETQGNLYFDNMHRRPIRGTTGGRSTRSMLSCRRSPGGSITAWFFPATASSGRTTAVSSSGTTAVPGENGGLPEARRFLPHSEAQRGGRAQTGAASPVLPCCALVSARMATIRARSLSRSRVLSMCWRRRNRRGSSHGSWIRGYTFFPWSRK